MATKKKGKKKSKKASSRRGSTSKRGGASRSPRALTMLEKDHKLVNGMFRQFERAQDDGDKREILQRICAALTAHAQLEEELFYPALRDALGEEGQDLLDEALVEHSVVKILIAQLEDADVGDDMVDAKVTVLSEYVKHHVEEEEGEIFPKAKRAGLDLDELSARMEERKVELEREAGVDEDGEAEERPRRGGRRGGRAPAGARG